MLLFFWTIVGWNELEHFSSVSVEYLLYTTGVDTAAFGKDVDVAMIEDWSNTFYPGSNR